MNYYTNMDQVAVILHDDYGNGWFSMHGELALLYDYSLAAALDSQNLDAATQRLEELQEEYPDAGINTVRAQNLMVEWVPRGRKFLIHEYDGYEAVWYKDQIMWQQA